MSVELAGQLGVAVLTTLAAALGVARVRRGPRDTLSGLREQASLLNELPGDVHVRQELVEHFEESVERYLIAAKWKRDPLTASIGVVFLAIAIFVAVLAIKAGGWWLLALLAAAFLTTSGISVVVQSLRATPNLENFKNLAREYYEPPQHPDSHGR